MSVYNINFISNKTSSAVAEMGDRLATTYMDRKVGGLCPFPWGELGLHLPSNNVAWAEAYLRTNGILIHPAVWPQYTNVTDR